MTALTGKEPRLKQYKTADIRLKLLVPLQRLFLEVCRVAHANAGAGNESVNKKMTLLIHVKSRRNALTALVCVASE